MSIVEKSTKQTLFTLRMSLKTNPSSLSVLPGRTVQTGYEPALLG